MPPKTAPVIIYYSNKVTTTILVVWFVSMSEVKYAVAVQTVYTALHDIMDFCVIVFAKFVPSPPLIIDVVKKFLGIGRIWEGPIRLLDFINFVM